MYVVEFCRLGKVTKYHMSINRKMKGAFRKEFNSIEELVEFMAKANRNGMRICIKEYITPSSKKDESIFVMKYRALMNIHKR